ncbi:MAG: CybS-domain-containing protein [Benjaminiella poitrasii]|nr:MAG: CybS-domain-containing protein [Benjaminiella poitrasii]
MSFLISKPLTLSTTRLALTKSSIFLTNNKKYAHSTNAISNKKDFKPDRKHGSVHWNLERGAAITMMPLIAGTFMFGPSTVSDVLLGVVLPFHVHMGFDSCITDYFNPKRAGPTMHKVMAMTLHTSTTVVMIGCGLFNYYDIGLTELIHRLWVA